ncbi:MAG: hypothetical protein J6Y29_01580 [Clostridiales bacterium]|nr:hypothetical protein [Clostridiales bacterium]
MTVKKILVTDVKKYDDISLYFSDKCNVGFEIGGYLVYSGTDDGDEYEDDENDMAGKYIGDCLVYISKRDTVKKIVTGMDKIIEKILE